MRYGEIIQRAARITWRNKAMWVFGTLLALFGGMSGRGGGSTGPQFTFSGHNPSRWLERMANGTVDWGALAAAGLALLGALALVGLFLAILGIIVRYTSIGALIGMAAEADAGERTTFKGGLRRGWQKLLTLFLIALVIGIVGFVIAVVIALAFIAMGVAVVLPAVGMLSAGGGWAAVGVIWLIALGIGLLGVMIAIAIILGGLFTVVQEYAYRAAVLHNQGVFDAIRTAITLVRERFWPSALFWLLLAAIQFALTLVLLPFIFTIGAGAGILAFALSSVARSAIIALILGVPLLAIAILVMLIGSGIFTAFHATAWTLFYTELRPLEEV